MKFKIPYDFNFKSKIRNWYSLICLGVLVFALNSCAIWPSNEEKSMEAGHQKQIEKEKASLDLFNKGTQAFDSGKYEEAIMHYEELIRKAPSTSIESITLFNLGLSHELLGNCKKAGSHFRRVVNTSTTEQARLHSMGMYHLSKAYSCVGNDVKAISTLLDLQKKLDTLPPEVAYAEIPAKLAAAYARQGNIDLAAKYYTEAEKGLSRVSALRMKPEEKSELLAKTLNSMGSMQIEKIENLDAAQSVKTVEFAQKYLLRSVELNHSVWSPRSAESLIKAYEKVGMKFTDPASKDENYSKSIQMALTNIEVLKRTRFPETQNLQIVKLVFDELQKKENEFLALLQKNSVQNPTTLENENRFGIKRDVNLKSPNSKSPNSNSSNSNSSKKSGR